jgi:hypothetical protein
MDNVLTRYNNKQGIKSQQPVVQFFTWSAHVMSLPILQAAQIMTQDLC